MLRNKFIRFLAWFFRIFLAIILVFVIIYKISTRVPLPAVPATEMTAMTRTGSGDTSFTCEHGWLKKAGDGWWLMYLDGNPYQVGYAHGLLTKELMADQEKAFTDRLSQLIPSHFYQRFMMAFTRYFNRNLNDCVLPEYREEIYGISQSAPPEYDWIAPAYIRMLNYHAAHDLGHAVQNMNLVACSAFGAWDGRTADSNLLIGRNFDFYVNDEFAANKILCFVQPDSGFRFVSVTWAGFAGVVSGMNEKGLTITLNAARAEFPFGAKTPVSLLAREILQYASNIEEALEIAKRRKTFVGETFLIGSVADGKAVVIEKSPDTTVVYDPGMNYILVTNHFQAEPLKGEELNVENLNNETSLYRLNRLRELVDEHPAMTAADAAAILRDYRGLGGKDIGLGNEKAVNQFICHHSIIFQPASQTVWVASPPWQLGEYRGYRMDSIPAGMAPGRDVTCYVSTIVAIPADTILSGPIYQNLVKYRSLAGRIAGGESNNIATDSLIRYNPNFFGTYKVLGDYFRSIDQQEEAAKYYQRALQCEAPSAAEREAVSGQRSAVGGQ